MDERLILLVYDSMACRPSRPCTARPGKPLSPGRVTTSFRIGTKIETPKTSRGKRQGDEGLWRGGIPHHPIRGFGSVVSSSRSGFGAELRPKMNFFTHI